MKTHQILSRIANFLVLVWALIASGCSSASHSTPGQNLPPDLQRVVGSDQSGEMAALYKLPDLAAPVRSLAVAEAGIYFVNDYDRGGFISEATMRPGYGIAPARNVRLLAVGGDARIVYLSGDDGVWRLGTGNEPSLFIGGPKDIEEMAASPDSKIIYVKAGNTLWWWQEGDTEWHHFEVKVDFQDLKWSFGVEAYRTAALRPCPGTKQC